MVRHMKFNLLHRFNISSINSTLHEGYMQQLIFVNTTVWNWNQKEMKWEQTKIEWKINANESSKWSIMVFSSLACSNAVFAVCYTCNWLTTIDFTCGTPMYWKQNKMEWYLNEMKQWEAAIPQSTVKLYVQRLFNKGRMYTFYWCLL